MTTAELLCNLRACGVALRVEGSRLRYSAPPGALTDALRAELTARKEEILQLLAGADTAAGATAAGATLPRIRATARAGELPSSFAQQRLWFLEQLEPGSALYNLPLALRLRGPLDAEALEASFQAILARHAVLRTRLQADHGRPTQVIASVSTLPFERIDLSSLPEAEREMEMRRCLKAQAWRPFDLRAAPLIRVALMRLQAEEHVLVVVMHHIVSDDWSVGVLLRELSALYDASRQGAAWPLADLPIQYADFAVWQREHLTGEVLERELAYWRDQLAGELLVLELPFAHPYPAQPTSRGAVHRFELSAGLTEALRQLSRREGATLFMTLLAGFQTLLHRYTQQDDILVSSPVAGRNQLETEDLIGCFVNLLVLRTDLSGDPTYRELLARVRQVALAAYAHQDLPFERLVAELQPERSLDRNPLTQVLFLLQQAPTPDWRLRDLAAEFMPIDQESAKFPLTLELSEGRQGLSGLIEYRTDLFAAATVQRMAHHLETLLVGIVRAPDRRVSELPLLSDAERHQLVVGWNETRAPYPTESCLHQLIQAQTARTPDRVAVTHAGRQLTFRELDCRANHLAHRLLRLGVGPDVVTGIFLDRSLELLVAILGVLKAGGAYLPLDPACPGERLSFMLEDAGVRVVLTRHGLATPLPPTGAHVVLVDPVSDTSPAAAVTPPESGVQPDHLAYVIYTSGSTGKPKGAMIHHRALVNYLSWCTQAYAVAQGQGAPVHSSIAFDLTVTGLFAPLLAGRPVHLLAEDAGIDSLRDALLQGADYSLVKITPAHLDLLRHVLPREAATGRTRAFIIGGENLDAESLSVWQERAPTTRLFNEYGPTETVVGCCVFEVPSGWRKPGSVPIGRPIANTQLYILDRCRQPAPAGIVGELYIGGDGVCRGYLRRPDLTAERFVPDPFSGQPGARLYRTGDLVRHLPDGHLEFLGRIDDQVKLRGYRIELGEIEWVLNQQPEVEESVVALREDTPGDPRLVGYVVLRDSQSLDPPGLLRRLADQLPDYMVPTALVALRELPLSPNGKLDRRRLPKPDAGAILRDQARAGPRSPCEEVIAETWMEVLGTRAAGIHDNFFDVGGHSLLAIRLIARLRDQFKVSLPLRSFFESPTIAGLAACIETETHEGQSYSRSGTGAWRFLVPIQSVGNKRPFYLFPGGLGSEQEFLVYAKLARHLGLDQPFYGLKASGGTDREPPHRSVEDMARDYVKEIREFQSQGPYLLVGECAGGILAFEAARQLVIQGEQVGLLAFLDTEFPRRNEYLWLQLELLKRKIAGFWPVWLLGRCWFHLWQFRRLRVDEWGRYLREKGRLGKQQLTVALQPAVPARLPALPHPAEFHYFKTLIRYRPKEYPGRVTLLLSEDVYRSGRAFSWRLCARGGLEIRTLPGNHFTYIREHVAYAAAQLLTFLRQAQTPRPANNPDHASAVQEVSPLQG